MYDRPLAERDFPIQHTLSFDYKGKKRHDKLLVTRSPGKVNEAGAKGRWLWAKKKRKKDDPI